MITDAPFVQDLKASRHLDARTAGFGLAGVLLELDSDDSGLIEEVASLLGRPRPGPSEAPPQIRATVRAAGVGDSGHLTLSMPRPDQLAPTDLLLAVSSPDFPFDLLESAGPRVVLALRGEREPALEVEGGRCRFALRPGWRKAVGLLLLQRLMRCREDALFFHAASVSLLGGGVLLVGAKGAGKSTLALALAARGHGLLGDENACYLPATGQLAPCRRPVGIKPGPRSRAVDSLLLARSLYPERDGMMRVPVEDLLAGPEPAPVPLRTVFFLGPRAAAPCLRALDPGRGELARLQPVGASLLDVPPTRRVFEMTRLLASARVYELTAGEPDPTAFLVEEALGAA